MFRIKKKAQNLILEELKPKLIAKRTKIKTN